MCWDCRWYRIAGTKARLSGIRTLSILFDILIYSLFTRSMSLCMFWIFQTSSRNSSPRKSNDLDGIALPFRAIFAWQSVPLFFFIFSGFHLKWSLWLWRSRPSWRIKPYVNMFILVISICELSPLQGCHPQNFVTGGRLNTPLPQFLTCRVINISAHSRPTCMFINEYI